MSSEGWGDAWAAIREGDEPFEFELEYVLQRPPVPLGVAPLDRALGGGVHPGTFTIIGGDPGSGKTALACRSAYTQAVQGFFPVFYSFEMTKMQLVSRLLSVHTRANKDRLASVRWSKLRESVMLPDDELRRLADANDRARVETVMRYVSRHADDDPVLAAWADFKRDVYPHMAIRDDVTDVSQVVEEIGSLCELGMHPSVIVDYLQLAAAGDGDEYQLVTNASHDLQRLAKRWEIPVTLLSSLRNLTKAERDDSPQLSQFRGSGHLGYDAGAAIVLRRGEGVIADREVGIFQEVTAHIIKNRFGEPGKVPLYFNGAYNMFAERNE